MGRHNGPTDWRTQLDQSYLLKYPRMKAFLVTMGAVGGLMTGTLVVRAITAIVGWL